MAVKVSYSNSGQGTTYGSRKARPAQTFNTVASMPQPSQRSLTAAASSGGNQPDSLARVLAGGQNVFGTNTAPKVQPATTAPPGVRDTTQTTTGQTGATFDQATLDADPIYAMIKNAGARSEQEAQGARTKGYETALTRFGDSTLAQTLLTKLGLADPEASTFAQSAAQNPLSTLAQIGRSYDAQRVNTDLDANQSNLYYSSARANRLSDLSQERLATEADAQDALMQLLGSYDSAYTQAQRDFEDRRLAAAGDAFGRWWESGASGQPAEPPAPNDAAGGAETPQRPGLAVGTPQTAPDYLTALMLAAATKRGVAL